MDNEQNVEGLNVSPAIAKPMLPAVFQKELDKLAKLNAAYKEQLDKVVDTLKDTYGHSPYDVDCDFFIDTYCQGAGNITVKQLDEQMRLCCP